MLRQISSAIILVNFLNLQLKRKSQEKQEAPARETVERHKPKRSANKQHDSDHKKARISTENDGSLSEKAKKAVENRGINKVRSKEKKLRLQKDKSVSNRDGDQMKNKFDAVAAKNKKLQKFKQGKFDKMAMKGNHKAKKFRGKKASKKAYKSLSV